MQARPAEPCAACGGETFAFHDQGEVPANSCILLQDAEAARRYPRGEIDLVFCRRCGFIGNRRFDPGLAEYSSRYEETQAFSPTFVEFARALASRWVEKYELHRASVLEIGCGKGEFLVMMCEAGAGEGIGIDPGIRPERIDSPVADRIHWIPDFYSAAYGHLDVDAVVCRHTLEHIQPVQDFMRTVREGIGDRQDTVVLFELPDVRRVLDDVAFWDVYYEHCSYFSAGSLARLFRSTGFDVLDVSLGYEGQYLLIEARPSAAGHSHTRSRMPLEETTVDLCRAALSFSARSTAEITGWQDRLAALQERGGRAAIWGAGSKGVAYLSALGVEADVVEVAVDVNPHKHGMHMAGTGHRIVSPRELAEIRPDLVIVMNPVYVDEISRELDSLGLEPDLVCA